MRNFFFSFSSYYGIDDGLGDFSTWSNMAMLISCITLVDAPSGVGLSKILKRAELDWPVLSYLDLDICSYAMCLTRDDVHGWEGRPWRKSNTKHRLKIACRL